MMDAEDEVHSNDRMAGTSPNTAVNDEENAGPNVCEVVIGGEKVHDAEKANLNISSNKEPQDGMEFESKEEAFAFYKEYARTIGFDTIIKASRRSRISGKFIDAKFVCTRYGNKQGSSSAEVQGPFSNTDCMTGIPVKRKRGRVSRSWSKTDCKACMHVKRRQDGRWIIRSFIKEHNHEIFPDQAYYFRGHRSINLGNNDVDALHAIRARTKKMYVSMSRQSGVNKKVENQKVGGSNKFNNECDLALEEGDAHVMLDHFLCMQDENPNFSYAMDLNKEQRLKNVLWVDAKSRLDYGSFNDVVCFDTTYIRNEYKLPFAPFVGVNHHFQFLLLGCALIADMSKSTFVWLMKAWLRAMGGSAPRVILTDRDKALKEAVAEVFPDSYHCFCLWYIWSLIPEKLSHIMRRHENFMSKFNKCIFRSWTIEQFEKRWCKLFDRFDLKDDLWLQSLYDDRQQWVPAYTRDIFLAGMSTTQRSESINSVFDKYIQRRTTLKDFFDQYKVFLREKYEEEAKADFETWHKQPGLKSPSPFGKQMAMIYTHTIFKKFQVEVLGVVACHPKKESENGSIMTYKVQDFEENQEFVVVWNEANSDISCLCRSFEYNGFLCRHAMILLQMSGMHNIPSQYILKRWTKDAKSRRAVTQQSHVIDSRVQRYNDICLRAFKLGDEGSLSQRSFTTAVNALEEALRKCESVNNWIQSVEPSLPLPNSSHDFQERNHGNNTAKSTNKKRKSLSNFQASTPDCSYETQESMEGMEHLNSSAPTLDCYFGTQQMVGGMGHSIAPSRDDYYVHQQRMQGLAQLNIIAPVHDDHYITRQRNHGLEQLHFRPENIQSCFDLQDSSQEMDQHTVRPTQVHAMALKQLRSKHISR